MKTTTLYRYVDHRVYEAKIGIYCDTFEVIKETPQGYWFDDFGKKRWVSKNAKRRYCYPSMEEAWESFLARKRRQLSILRSDVRYCETLLSSAPQDAPEQPVLMSNIEIEFLEFDFNN